MPKPHDAKQNYLLAAMPDAEFERIAPQLERVSLARGEVLYEFEADLKYGYFPTTALAVLMCNMEDGTSTEVAVVGNEGVLGVSIFLSEEGALTQAVVQHAGDAYRLKATHLKAEFDHCGQLQHVLLRYTQTLLTQMAQTTGCNRAHTVEQQLCRWLLQNMDRLPTDELRMTQEFIASMLGVRRESVTEAAGKLQQAGLISYCRGHIEILDRPRLEAQACECYDVVKKQYDGLMADLSEKTAG
jgi:CRP-like cAMP-binding protein